MGDMSLMAQCDAIDEEGARDEFVAGHMSMGDAYDRGFLDSEGCETEGITAAWERSAIPTMDNLQRDLDDALSDLSSIGRAAREKYSANQLNALAIANLSNEYPTCNICAASMSPRSGAFGKFYFCGGGCKEQGTVSDKYWQSVRR